MKPEGNFDLVGEEKGRPSFFKLNPVLADHDPMPPETLTTAKFNHAFVRDHLAVDAALLVDSHMNEGGPVRLGASQGQ